MPPEAPVMIAVCLPGILNLSFEGTNPTHSCASGLPKAALSRRIAGVRNNAGRNRAGIPKELGKRGS
jgi:hypothetical protein